MALQSEEKSILEGMGGTALRLPFNIVDEGIFHLDIPDEPWSVFLEVGLKGRLHAQRLAEAIEKAMALHPLVRARRLPSRFIDRSYWWEIDPKPLEAPLHVVECPDDASLRRLRESIQSAQVPVDRPPLFSVHLARCADSDRLLLNISHVACDGIGTLRLLRSIARAYADEQDRVPDVDLAAVRDLTTQLAARDVRNRARRVQELLKYAANAMTSPAARVAPEGATSSPGYGCGYLRLTAEETSSMQQKRPMDATINDLLLAGLHQAIDSWNKERNHPCGRIGVMMPLNMRPKALWYEVVSNLSLFMSISSEAEHRRGDGSLTACITEQTRRFKDGAGAALIEVLSGSPLLPVGVKAAMPGLLPLTGNRFVETANLSNFGRLAEPLNFGADAGGEAVELWFAPPCRMPIGVSFGTLTIGGCLHLALRYRRCQFDEPAARRFLDSYRACLLAPGQ